MTENGRAGRVVLFAVLAGHLTAWLWTLVLFGRHTDPAAWAAQVPLWVLGPAALVWAALRGRAWARWAFAAVLALLALGDAAGAVEWGWLALSDGLGLGQFVSSAVLDVAYATGAAVAGLSAAVRRAVAAGHEGTPNRF